MQTDWVQLNQSKKQTKFKTKNSPGKPELFCLFYLKIRRISLSKSAILSSKFANLSKSAPKARKAGVSSVSSKQIRIIEVHIYHVQKRALQVNYLQAG